MTPAEDTNRLIAEWMGWTVVQDAHRLWHAQRRGDRPLCTCYTTPESATSDFPDYLTDLNACAEFERVLVDRGLWRKWNTALTDIVTHSDAWPFSDWLRDNNEAIQFALATATAPQRCAAMVAVLDGEVDGG